MATVSSTLVRFVSALSLAVAPLAAQQRMTPELLWELQRVSDVQVSPDGSAMLYHVRGYELADNRGTTQIWLRDTAVDATARRLTTQGSNWNGRWSPDGKEIAFVSTRDGSAQIYRIAVDGGEAWQVSDHEGGVSNMAWSPTGEHFSFTASVQLEPTMLDRHPDLPLANAKVYDDLMVRHWDHWKDGTYSHLFVLDAKGGAARDLMAGERVDTPLQPFGGGEQIAWAPDGKSLVYTAKRVPHPEASTDSALYHVAVAPGSKHRNLTEGMPGYEINPAFSPDGSKLAFESMARDGYESDRNRLMVQELATGAVRELTEGWGLSSTEFAWMPDGRSIALCADKRGTRQIFVVATRKGASPPAQLSTGRFHFGGLAVAPNGSTIYATRAQTERPNEIVALEVGRRPADGGRAVTDVNGAVFADLQLPRVAQREVTATDGKTIHCWVTYPPNFDPKKKYPMLTYCQGGPQSQVGQWFSFRWNFHLMAAQGYIVLGVNRRGLPGFGTEWNEQISRDWGGQAMQDILSATDAMFEEPYVDRARTAAIGASFGGYTVYWLMGHDRENRFCSMVSHCGVMNLESMYLSTEELFFVNWDLGGPYWRGDVRRDYKRFSPHEFVQNWDTPLLVIHGQKDFRVPLEQGLQAFQAAQLQGCESRFLYFPTESHWVLSPQNGVVWHREFFAWLDKYCKPVAAKPKTGRVDTAASKQRTPLARTESTLDTTQVEPAGREYLIEQIGDTAIAQLYADGFDKLTMRQKRLCYWLSKAAVAGREIFLDQKFVYNRVLRDTLEELYTHRQALQPDVAKEIERYTKLFWVHNGIHHAVSARKMLLGLTKSQFTGAVRKARRAGASFSTGLPMSLLYNVMADPDSYASATNKSPGDGLDPLNESSNNLYVNVATSDLDGFEERYPLNSRLKKKRDGTLVEEVYRAGHPDEGIPPGRYADELRKVIKQLELAMPFAPEKTKAALRALVRYYRTGDPEDWRKFNIAWVQDTDSVVDQINGFVEVYLDVRGQKGSWEAVVSYLNTEKTGAIESLAKQAQWFEDRMPWDDKFKKEQVKGITARAISVIMETGDSGPVTPIGINLPNEVDIRENYGSKSVNLSNVVEAYDGIRSGGSLGEFAWSTDEIARAKKWGRISGDIHTNLHEVVGHASGKLMPEIQNPASRLGLYYSTLEEGRADLVGLYWIADPKLIEMGIVPHPDAALAEYEGYARNALVQLRRVPRGHKLEEDHMRNRQLVVLWLIENAGDAITVQQRDGKTFYVVTDKDAFREGCGRLLAEIMRIKATGDFKAGKALVEKYGTRIEPKLHDEVLARMEKLGLPSVTGFVQPELRLVRDAANKVVDIEVFYPRDIADQMLRWSGRKPSRR